MRRERKNEGEKKIYQNPTIMPLPTRGIPLGKVCYKASNAIAEASASKDFLCVSTVDTVNYQVFMLNTLAYFLYMFIPNQILVLFLILIS